MEKFSGVGSDVHVQFQTFINSLDVWVRVKCPLAGQMLRNAPPFTGMTFQNTIGVPVSHNEAIKTIMHIAEDLDCKLHLQNGLSDVMQCLIPKTLADDPEDGKNAD